MNTIHDMGGMHGMGPIDVREDERRSMPSGKDARGA
jgi:hypothetical protein